MHMRWKVAIPEIFLLCRWVSVRMLPSLISASAEGYQLTSVAMLLLIHRMALRRCSVLPTTQATSFSQSVTCSQPLYFNTCISRKRRRSHNDSSRTHRISLKPARKYLPEHYTPRRTLGARLVRLVSSSFRFAEAMPALRTEVEPVSRYSTLLYAKT